jgi:hypothetical protein
MTVSADCTFLFLSFGATATPTPQWAPQGLLIHEVSRSHTTTHHSRKDSSGRVISPSHRPLPDNTQRSQQTDIQAPRGIRTHNLSRPAAADPHLRPRGYWDRQLALLSLHYRGLVSYQLAVITIGGDSLTNLDVLERIRRASRWKWKANIPRHTTATQINTKTTCSCSSPKIEAFYFSEPFTNTCKTTRCH